MQDVKVGERGLTLLAMVTPVTRAAVLSGYFCFGVADVSRAETSTQQEVAQAINAGFDALNRGDVIGLKAFYDPTATVVDDVPPYLWRPPGALLAWQASDALWAKARGVSSVICVLKKTIRNEVTGDRAYFVGRGDCTVVTKGIPNRQDGTWTFVMARRTEGWRAVVMSWAGDALRR